MNIVESLIQKELQIAEEEMQFQKLEDMNALLEEEPVYFIEGMYGNPESKISITTRIASWLKILRSKNARMVSVCDQLLKISKVGISDEVTKSDINTTFVMETLEELEKHMIKDLKMDSGTRLVFLQFDPGYQNTTLSCFMISTFSLILTALNRSVREETVTDDELYQRLTEIMEILTPYLQQNFAPNVKPKHGLYDLDELVEVRNAILMGSKEYARRRGNGMMLTLEEKMKIHDIIKSHEATIKALKEYQLVKHAKEVNAITGGTPLMLGSTQYTVNLYLIADALYNRLILVLNDLERIGLELHKL